MAEIKSKKRPAAGPQPGPPACPPIESTPPPASPGVPASLKWLIFLNVCLFIAEITTSEVTHSLVILLDGYHVLYTLIGISLQVAGHKLQNNPKQTVKATFGWARIEVLGGLINDIFTVALCFGATVESIQALCHLAHEDFNHGHKPVVQISLGICSVVLKLIGLIALKNHDKNSYTLNFSGKDVHINFQMSGPSSEDPNGGSLRRIRKRTVSKASQKSQTESVELVSGPPGQSSQPAASQVPHQDQSCAVWRILRCGLVDFGTSLLVIVAPLMDLFLPTNMADLLLIHDPVLCIISVGLLCALIYPSMRATGLILLQTLPERIDIEALKTQILTHFPEIINLHDFHMWCLTDNQLIATFHIAIHKPKSAKTYQTLTSRLQDFLRSAYGIQLVTIQPEFIPQSGRTSTSEGPSTSAGALETSTSSRGAFRGNASPAFGLPPSRAGTPSSRSQCLIPCQRKPSDEDFNKRNSCVADQDGDDDEDNCWTKGCCPADDDVLLPGVKPSDQAG